MFEPDQYSLLDFGNGQKIESFGGRTVLRETKSVGEFENRSPFTTNQHLADLAFRLKPVSHDDGTWIGQCDLPWTVRHQTKHFLLKPTPTGQVGLFPEQANNWEWIETRCQTLENLRGLNLFGYTGGTTLSLASLGAAVVHVDAAPSVVRWAKENAVASSLGQAPIRWIVEDALKFVKREAKRGNRYNILVADPPSYGKGPKRERWKLSDHFEELLSGLAEIAADSLAMLIISCHTMGYDEQHLLRLIRRVFDLSCGFTEALSLELEAVDGRKLVNGYCVRFVSNQLIR